VLAACPCKAEGRVACHRCLLGVVRPRDIPAANRTVALDLLEDVLDGWSVEKIDTVGTIDIAPVQLSELELRFRESLKNWIDGQDGYSYTTSIGPTGEQLDLRLLSPDGEPRRWTMRPLVNVTAGSITTQPDFVLTRSDAQGCDVALYLDGRQFHASVTHNNTADDATKRAALRDSGWRTFSLTWGDVEAFYKPPKNPAPHLVVIEAENDAEAEVNDPRIRAMWANPVGFLLAYLADPDAAVWGTGATRTVLAIIPPGKHGAAAHVSVSPRSLQEALHDLSMGKGSNGDGSIMVVPRQGRHGLRIWVIADPTDHLASLGVLTVLDDHTSEVGGPEHEAQWHEWLRWSNLLQFLTLPNLGQELPSRMAEVWTSRSLDAFGLRHLPLGAVSGSKPTLDIVPPRWQVVLDFSDAAVHPVVALLAASDGSPPEPGDEVGDEEVWQVELSWPSEKVAVTVDEVLARDNWLKVHGWRVISVTEDVNVPHIAAQIEAWLTAGSQ